MSIQSEDQIVLNGVELYTKTWTPKEHIKAKLVFVHGYSDHINLYNEFFNHLAAQGIQTFGWDQRGWGRSAPNKSDWGLTGSTRQITADVSAFISDKLAQSQDVPLFVMGHSMGGGEICTLMCDPQYEKLVGRVRGWMLEAPFIGFTPGFEPSVIKLTLARLASWLLPTQQLQHSIPAERLSRDPLVVESTKSDTLCHNTFSFEGLASMLDRTASLSSGRVRVGNQVQSLFLAHGTDDKACDINAATSWMTEQTNIRDKTTKIYKEAYHQLHNDLCKKEFFIDTASWILERSI